MRTRLIAGLLMAGALVGAAYGLSPAIIALLCAAVGGRALAEFYRLLGHAGIPSYRILGVIGGVAVILSNLGLPGLPAGLDDGALALFAAMFALFVRQFGLKNNPRPLETLAGSLMGLLYVAFQVGFFVRLLNFDASGQGRWLLLYLIFVVKFNDVGAFFIGCTIGRHRMVPRISPAKSWEGFAGGLLTAVAVSLVIQWVGEGWLGPVRFTRRDAVLLALLLSVVGVLGDLMESQLKRAAGMKDAGRLIAGMGGMLDVVDSLLPAAPVLYFYLKVVMHAGGG